MDDKQDQLDRHINDYAERSFRDVADRDYIAARLALRAGLIPQFLWSAQQAFEKYLKYLLLVNRIPAKKVRHDIQSALALTSKLPFALEIRPPGRELIDHVATYGEYRYLDVSYFIHGPALVQLDMAVWDLRRYCQILDVRGKLLPPEEQRMLEAALATLKASSSLPPQKFRLHRGFLEDVIATPKHPARSGLIWRNGFYGVKPRTKVRVQRLLQASNAPLYLYPDMLDELLKYVFIPAAIERGYREHLAAILKDPARRP